LLAQPRSQAAELLMHFGPQLARFAAATAEAKADGTWFKVP
jgi:hypothetical protein